MGGLLAVVSMILRIAGMWLALLLRVGGIFLIIESSNSITWYAKRGEMRRLPMAVRAARLILGLAMVLLS